MRSFAAGMWGYAPTGRARSPVNNPPDKHRATPGTWLWVRPGQIQQFRDRSMATGWVVLFQPGALDVATVAEAGISDPFAATQWQLSPSDTQAAALALEHLAASFASPPGLPAGVRAQIMRHVLAALVLRLRFQAEPVGSPAAPHSEAFLRFREAVERQFSPTRRVGDYARELGYAPRTLTRATLASSGVGVKAFIDRRVILEAQRLLVHSETPVVQIASQLGFEDPSNFVKFFAQRTGATPAAFREQIGT
jgi:AraC-like DNA-binding protein